MSNDSSVSEKRLYKSHIKFCNIHLPSGRRLDFKGGMFVTDESDVIAFLDTAIARDEYAGQIFIDPNARTITAEQENPMLALKKKFFEEFLAKQAAHNDSNRDMGTSEQGPLNAASTTDIAPTALGGPGSAALMKLIGRSAPSAA